MNLSPKQIGAIIQGAGGFVLIALIGVVFFPGYRSGIARPVATATAGLVFCGLALGNFDERRQRVGTAWAAMASIGTVAAAVYILATTGGGVENFLATFSAGSGALALILAVLTCREQIRHRNTQLLELSAISSMMAAIVLLGLPQASDEPFRTIFFMIAGGAAVYGVLLLGIALVYQRIDLAGYLEELPF